MSKICPFTNEKVVYLDCVECDDKNKCGKASYKAETNISYKSIRRNAKAISVTSFGYTIKEAKDAAFKNIKAVLKKLTNKKTIKVFCQQTISLNGEYVEGDEDEIEIEL